MGAIVVVALLAAPVATAIEVSGAGALTGPVFRPEIGDEILVFVSNAGRRPVNAEVLVLRAADYSVVSATPVAVPPRTTGTISHVVAEGLDTVVAVRYRAAGRTVLRVSMQVNGVAGDNGAIFADGFESGDLSA